MLGVIGLFGDLPFVCSQSMVLTFRDLQREKTTKFAQHEVIGQKPVLEWVGEGADKITFKMRFDNFLNAPPLAGLTMLEMMLETHEAHLLLIGGEYFGRFVLESISEERKHHSGAGICTVAEATVTLTEVA